VVDNTFATPYNQRPLALGADVVLHSATKYLGGHSDVVGGCVVTDAARAERLWHKRTLLGGCLDPFAAWLLLRGIKTLALRMQSHNRNALAVAEALQSHPAVAGVMYPGLSSHPQHELARRQMTGFGGMVSFELVGGREAGVELVESTRLAVLAVSLGSVETLIEHPASMSHAQLSDEQLHRAGIPPGLVRLSVGIEDPNDLIADLKQALDRVGQ
jgi:cystathionine beta-lyase/cystathionine gamma-synthase